MPTVLLLDAYTDPPFAAAHFSPWLTGAEVMVVRPALDPLPPSTSFDALVVTGSHCSVNDPDPWIASARALTRRCVETGVPVLGVCWGHQLLAAAVGARVFRRPAPEVGFPEVSIDRVDDPVLGALPARFRPFVSHADEVEPHPSKLRILGHNSACPVHAFRVQDRPAWGVQFHLEYAREEVASILHMRAVNHPELGLDPQALLAELPDLSTQARALFGAFLKEIPS